MEETEPLAAGTTEEAAETVEIPEDFAVKSLEVQSSAVGSLKCDDAQITSSAVGVLTAGRDVALSTGFACAVLTAGDAEIAQSGAFDVIAKGDMRIKQGGGCLLAAGGDVSIDGPGGAGMVVARSAAVRHGWVGVLVSSDAEIAEDSRVIMDWKAGLAFGLGFGLVGAVAAAMIVRPLVHAIRSIRLPFAHRG